MICQCHMHLNERLHLNDNYNVLGYVEQFILGINRLLQLKKMILKKHID